MLVQDGGPRPESFDPGRVPREGHQPLAPQPLHLLADGRVGVQHHVGRGFVRVRAPGVDDHGRRAWTFQDRDVEQSHDVVLAQPLGHLVRAQPGHHLDPQRRHALTPTASFDLPPVQMPTRPPGLHARPRASGPVRAAVRPDDAIPVRLDRYGTSHADRHPQAWERSHVRAIAHGDNGPRPPRRYS
ncbi:hypothetical protein GCM10009533_23730 [Saccharopolyspora spinosporotrichia]|uniref:Uncharacterized protein n=1 Tax=Saccharopolyspora erythraea TaxID=1836 RepID=A0ABN1CQS8_SACER